MGVALFATVSAGDATHARWPSVCLALPTVHFYPEGVGALNDQIESGEKVASARLDTGRRQAFMHAALLVILLLPLRWIVADHPRPVHPDEAAFMAGIGFPSDYPVHHPGYPLWVALGTAAELGSLSSYWSFAAWSLAASIVAPVLALMLFRRFVSNGAALALALAYGLNPLMWFSSVTALTYCAAAAFGMGVVLLSVASVAQRSPARLYTACVLLSIGTLVRADLAVYAGPIVLYAALRSERRTTMIRALAILATGAAVALLTTEYLYARSDMAEAAARLEHTRGVLLGQSVFRAGLIDGLLRNGVKIAMNLAWHLGFGFPLAVWAAMSLIRHAPIGGRGATGVRLMIVLWLVPGLVFLLCLHVAQGYFLPLLGGAYLLIGAAAEHHLGRRSAARLAYVVAAFSLAQFLFYPWSSESTGWKRTIDAKIGFISRVGLSRIDERPRIHTEGDTWPASKAPSHESTFFKSPSARVIVPTHEKQGRFSPL